MALISKSVLAAGILLSCTGTALAEDSSLVLGIIGAITQQAIQQANQPPRDEAPQRVFRVQDEEAERLYFRQEIQRRLNLLGFDAGYPDGRFGAKTRNAIASFQQSIGRSVTGKITESEVSTLYDQTNDGERRVVAQPNRIEASRPTQSSAADASSTETGVMQLAPAVTTADIQAAKVAAPVAEAPDASAEQAPASERNDGEGAATLSLEPAEPLPPR